MPTWELNRKNMERFTSKLRRRVYFVKNRTAVEACRFLIDFGYHAYFKSGPNHQNGSGWSYYYAANWNINISTPINATLIPERRYDEPQGSYADDLSAKRDSFDMNMADHAGDESIYVTNSVWYGKLLNNGGSDDGLFVGKSRPNRFMEQCLEHIRITVPAMIKQAKQEIM